MLALENIHKTYVNGFGFARSNTVVAQNISFVFTPEKIIGLVGPSGSGKSTLGQMVLRLEKPDRGRITFENEDIWKLNRSKLKRFRKMVQMVPQHPDAAFNPRLKLSTSLKEVFRFHHICPEQDQQDYLDNVLDQVMVPKELLSRYPSQLSGGEIQRLAIARAVILRPAVLILDEVTSMLDVSVQATVVRTLEKLHRNHAAAYLFITHNLALAKVFCHEIYSLKEGRIEALDTCLKGKY